MILDELKAEAAAKTILLIAVLPFELNHGDCIARSLRSIAYLLKAFCLSRRETLHLLGDVESEVTAFFP